MGLTQACPNHNDFSTFPIAFIVLQVSRLCLQVLWTKIILTTAIKQTSSTLTYISLSFGLRSQRLANKRTGLEAESRNESPTIRKVKECFGEAKKQLLSPIQECVDINSQFESWYCDSLKARHLWMHLNPNIVQVCHMFLKAV